MVQFVTIVAIYAMVLWRGNIGNIQSNHACRSHFIKRHQQAYVYNDYMGLCMGLTECF